MKRLLVRVLPVVLGLLSACAVDHPAHATRAANRPPPLPVPAPSAPALSLTARLGQELSARPEVAVHAERLQALLSLRGIRIVRLRQVLASPIGARYCAGLVSDRGLGASLCEFANDEAAAYGMALSHSKFERVLPGRTLLLNANTLLTLSAAEGEAQAQADVIAALFTTLRPESLRTL